MTDETTTETPEGQEPEAKGLRKQLNEAHAQLKVHRDRDMARSFGEIGLDPGKGLGKAIAKEYKGEVTTEALTEYAIKEYEFEVPVTPDPQSQQAQQIAQSHAALDGVQSAAGSIAPPTQQDVLAKAESDQNYDTTIAIKGAQLGKMLRPNQ